MKRKVPMANHPLTEYHDGYDPIVYAWNARTALVQIAGWICTLVPSEGDAGRELSSFQRAAAVPLIEAAPERSATIPLGVLAVWASRRQDTARFDLVYGEVGRDPQLVHGVVFDRVAIRQSLRWLFQHRVAADALVQVETVRVPDTAEGVCVLRMRCGEWMGIVMCHVPGSRHGDDPLFGEAPNG